jgi:hypothetical protein
MGSMSPARFKLILYVQPDNSGEALSRLYKALEHHSYSDYELAIIDVTQEPAKAQAAGIGPTPMLISEMGNGKRIVDHNLNDIDQLRRKFGFNQQ